LPNPSASDRDLQLVWRLYDVSRQGDFFEFARQAGIDDAELGNLALLVLLQQGAAQWQRRQSRA
jgi:hypothetical protein